MKQYYLFYEVLFRYTYTNFSNIKVATYEKSLERLRKPYVYAFMYMSGKNVKFATSIHFNQRVRLRVKYTGLTTLDTIILAYNFAALIHFAYSY